MAVVESDMRLASKIPSAAEGAHVESVGESKAASRVHAWQRWLPLCHGSFYVALAVGVTLSFFDAGNSSAERAAIVGLAVGLTAWFASGTVSSLAWRLPLPQALAFFVAGWALWGALVALDPTFWFLAVPLVWFLVMVVPKRFAIPMTVVFGAALVSVEVATENGVGSWLIGPILSVAAAIFLALYVNAIISESSKRQGLIEELQATRAQLAESERRQGALEERQRLAREIHDTLAQGFTSIAMLLEAAKGALSTRQPEVEQHLELATQTARENLAEARRVVWALRPEALDEGTLPEAVAALTERWSKETGIRANAHVTGKLHRLPADHEATLLRAAQEALVNVRKHASATSVDVTLSYWEELTVLDVQDDGIGFDLTSPRPVSGRDGGFGLDAMRQRVEGLGGQLQIESAPGQGSTVVVELPAPR